MAFINIELKARTGHADRIRRYLVDRGADCMGIDRQTDTYFNVARGRLKLRQGIIENALIYYERTDQPDPKQSDCTLIEIVDPAPLKEILTRSLGIKVVVSKIREIYYIDNIKFHLDSIPQLGSFVEIEASDKNSSSSRSSLQQQCDFYKNEFEIRDEDLVAVSYSDMFLDCEQVPEER